MDVVVAPKEENKFQVERIIYDGQDIFYAADGVTLVNNYGFDSPFLEEVSVMNFEAKLASNMAVPLNRMVVAYSDSRAKDTSLLVPYFYKIQRLSS
jgi:hypothetical protein